MAKFKDILRNIGSIFLSVKKERTEDVKKLILYSILEDALKKQDKDPEHYIKKIVKITLDLIRKLTLSPEVDSNDITMSNLLKSKYFINMVTDQVVNLLKKENLDD